MRSSSSYTALRKASNIGGTIEKDHRKCDGGWVRELSRRHSEWSLYNTPSIYKYLSYMLQRKEKTTQHHIYSRIIARIWLLVNITNLKCRKIKVGLPTHVLSTPNCKLLCENNEDIYGSKHLWCHNELDAESSDRNYFLFVKYAIMILYWWIIIKIIAKICMNHI